MQPTDSLLIGVVAGVIVQTLTDALLRWMLGRCRDH